MNRTLLLFVMGIATAICLLFLLILLLRLTDSWKTWSYARRSKSWESILFFYLGDMISLEEAAKSFGVHYQQMWTFILPYLRSIRGEEHERLKELIKETGLSHYYLQKMYHGSLKTKIKAASVMGTLGDKEAAEEIQKLLQSKDNEVAAIAAQSLSDLGEVSMLIPVMRRILSQSYTTFEGTTGLTVRFGRKVCPMIVELIYSWQAGEVDLQEIFAVPSYQSLSLFIDILGHHHYREESKVYESLLHESEHPEVLIHLFKALAKMDQQVLVDLQPFLHHEDWVVRSQSAKYIGQIKDRDYVDDLTTMLTDEMWWVKYHAGEALLHLGEKDLLREIASTKEPGAAMSSYILSKDRSLDEEDLARDDKKEMADVEEDIELEEALVSEDWNDNLLEEELQEEDLLYVYLQLEDQTSGDIWIELVELEEKLSLFLERTQGLQKTYDQLSLMESRIESIHTIIKPLLKTLEEEREYSSLSVGKRVEDSFKDFKEELLREKELDIEGPQGHVLEQLWHKIYRLEDLSVDMALLSFNAIIFSAHLGARGKPFGIIAHHIKESSLYLEEKSDSLESLFKGLFPQYSMIDSSIQKERLAQLEGLESSCLNVFETFKDMDPLLKRIHETTRDSLDSLKEMVLEPQRERLEKILALVCILKDKSQEFLSILKEERRVSFTHILFIEDSLSLLESSTQMVLGKVSSFFAAISSFQVDLFEELQEILFLSPSHFDDKGLEMTPLKEWGKELERDGIEEEYPSSSTISLHLSQIENEIYELERKILFFTMLRIQAKIELERLGGSVYITQIQKVVEELQELIESFKEVFLVLQGEIEEDRETFYGSIDAHAFSLNGWMALKTSLEELKRCKRDIYQNMQTLYEEIEELFQGLKEREDELREIELGGIGENLSSIYAFLKEKTQLLHHSFKEYRVEDELEDERDVSHELWDIYRSYALDLDPLNRDKKEQ